MLFKPFANVILGKIYGLCTKKSNHGLFELYALVGGGQEEQLSLSGG